ncbi:MAG: Chaperone protein DnaJ [Methanoregula sp. PtaU1.Bin006]|uniref:J domain-containing protein n=1 Tax=Methanoregula sp. PtaU1.Bin006 TaxID=1811681 RepID=UPI0009CFDAEA|nr:J domain-containing protein [Methanoregula sp. PtaU1.Bin006]OPY32793.1 MAG: Chaperone protein DnaJ [Methanoregula sp. PtaU1.Bin006]
MKLLPVMTVPEAAATFGITGGASMNEIHARFRELAKEWHPDTSVHELHISHETFIRIREAYTLLVNYCMNCEISFRPEDIRNGAGYDSREYWMSRFGDDPIWG